MGSSRGNEQRIVESIEPRQLGLGDLYYRLNEAVIVGEAGSGRIVLWNDGCERVFGYSSEEALGLSIEALVPEQLKLAHRAGISNFLRGGQARVLDSGTPVELPAVHKNGSPLIVRLTLTAISGEGLPGSYVLAVVRDITEHRQAEVALQDAHDELAETVAQLTRRTRELTLIRELGELLSTCGTVEEFGEVVQQIVPQLFPTEAGALHLLAPSRNELELVASWGYEPESTFAPNDCWGLRQGRPHIVGADGVGPRCLHVEAPTTQYLCVPMAAQGDSLGLFHLQRADEESQEDVAAIREFAISVSEHVAFKVANFRLRESLRNQSIRDPLTGMFNRRHAVASLERELHRAAR